jgi:L-aspartate oxidase
VSNMLVRTDVLVVGSGIAGLFYALRVADHRKVVLVTKKQTVESNTNYAQGGIASVFSENDSLEMHIRDTIEAGAGLCHEDTVRLVVNEGPRLVSELIEIGARFTMHDGDLDLGREGGHSRNRIVHAKDLTGQEIERALVARAVAHPNVTILENHVAIDLITEHNLRSKLQIPRDLIHCWGAYVLDKENGIVKTFLASTTVLSTGGCGCVYLHTTNPPIATGDGIAMAFRAGATIANMEFIQFHPTSLNHPDAQSFLISEAVRGHGAVLRNARGERFMERYDPRKELAPRDIVARAIDNELKRSGDASVFLDLRHLDPEDVRNSFPTIYARCLSYNIDLARDLVPVVPAAHYVCGGVVSDLHGRSGISGLFVCGEVAMTGLHGANRLASNSLLEALVFAHRAGEATLAGSMEVPPTDDIPDWDDSGTLNMEEWVLVSHNRDELRRLMWDYVGIVRSTLRLQRAQRRIRLLHKEVEDFYKRTKVAEDLIELRNMTTVASLIIESALQRRESRGLHYTTDYPSPNESLSKGDTFVSLFGTSLV